MFSSASICSRYIVETLRSKDLIKLCAAKLQAEREEFDFLLDATYCDARDVKRSLEQYKIVILSHGKRFSTRSDHFGQNHNI